MTQPGSMVRALPVYGLHWRIDDRWVSSDLGGPSVQPVMTNIWRTYLAPIHANVIRLHIDIMSYSANPIDGQEAEANARAVRRLINLCRFALDNGLRLVPILAGSRQYRRGKEMQLPRNVEAFIRDLLRALDQTGDSHLYRQIAFWQVEDEMNHFIRHAGWAEAVYTKTLLTACASIRCQEEETAAPCHVPRMVIFPADMVFFKDFLFRPWRYVPVMLREGFYQFRPPEDLSAFVCSDAVDVIGVDMYPGLYAPLATVQSFIRLVQHMCQTYGTQSPYRKRILVAEAGCPTWPSGPSREKTQLRFYQELLTGLSQYFWCNGGREQGLVGLVWYCFNDQRIKPVLWPPQEWRFGIVKTIPHNEWFATYPAEPKMAWYWLRDSVTPAWGGEEENA